MQAASAVTDSLNRTWTLGEPLGRGTWGKCWLLIGERSRRAVLKVPLTARDFHDPESDELVAACEVLAKQQITLLEQSAAHHPQLEATVDLGEGRKGLVLTRYAATLERRLADGLSLAETLRTAARVAQLMAEHGPHGALHPANILFDDTGEIILSDQITHGQEGVAERLRVAAERRSWWPPEATGHVAPSQDTWALCLALYWAAQVPPPGVDQPRSTRPTLPEGGLDRMALSTLKDHAMARLAQERANPRFRGRLSERLGALLNRGLSLQAEPSPPYRFNKPADLQDRLLALVALYHPSVVDAGKVNLAGMRSAPVFQGGEDVAFTVNVGCSEGIKDHTHEDLVCGLRLTDLDAPGDGRVSVADARFEVSSHPSGRLRYSFTLPGVPPGRYQVRCAFTIKDSGDTPIVAEGAFEVRPAPGYVPPKEQPVSAPISLQERLPSLPERPPEEELQDPYHTEAETEVTAPRGELISDAFPRPIAPPQSDPPMVREARVQVEPDPAPTPGPADPRPTPVASVTPFPGTPMPISPPEAPRPVRPPSGVVPPLAAVPTPPPTEPSDPGVPSTPVRPAPVVMPTTAPAIPEAGGGVEQASLGEQWMTGPAIGSGELADEGEDLPTWEEGPVQRTFPGAALIELLLRDTYTSVVAAIAVCLFLVLLFAVLLKAC